MILHFLIDFVCPVAFVCYFDLPDVSMYVKFLFCTFESVVIIFRFWVSWLEFGVLCRSNRSRTWRTSTLPTYRRTSTKRTSRRCSNHLAPWSRPASCETMPESVEVWDSRGWRARRSANKSFRRSMANCFRVRNFATSFSWVPFKKRIFGFQVNLALCQLSDNNDIFLNLPVPLWSSSCIGVVFEAIVTVNLWIYV